MHHLLHVDVYCLHLFFLMIILLASTLWRQVTINCTPCMQQTSHESGSYAWTTTCTCMYDIRQEVLDVGRAWKRGYKTGCQSVITIQRLSRKKYMEPLQVLMLWDSYKALCGVTACGWQLYQPSIQRRFRRDRDDNFCCGCLKSFGATF